MHSIVLLAVVDANYNFVIVDVGAYGRQSDASVFANSAFGKMLKSNKLLLSEEKSLPRTMGPQMLFIFVGDEAFSEAFGILTARFRVFRRPLMVSVGNAETVVKGAMMLHNFLCQETAIIPNTEIC